VESFVRRCLRLSLRAVLRILLHSQTPHTLGGMRERTAMWDERSGRARRNKQRSRGGGEDEGRGCTHRGIISTTFGYAGGNTIPRSYCPFGKNGSGTRCLPLILERCVEHSISKNQQAQAPRLGRWTWPGRDPGRATDCRRAPRYTGLCWLKIQRDIFARLGNETVFIRTPSRGGRISAHPIPTQWGKHPKAS